MSLVYVDIKEVHKPKLFGRRSQPYYWVALSGDNFKVLGRSSENYTNRQDCIDAVTLLFGTGSNVFLRQTEQGDEVLRYATTGEQANKNRIESLEKAKQQGPYPDYGTK